MIQRLQLIPFLSIFAAMALQAQTPANHDDTAARRQAASEAMEISLEQQRLSIQTQLQQQKHLGGDSFFQLPRPATLGATVAAPAPAIGLPECDPLPASQADALIDSAATRESLDPDLLRGVIRQESAFRPCAISPKGAQGLMQLMPATAYQFGVLNPFDPVQNVDGGAKLLKQLLTRYSGDLSKALGAYNAGPAKVDAADGIPPIPETQDYVKQILSLIPVINH